MIRNDEDVCNLVAKTVAARLDHIEPTLATAISKAVGEFAVDMIMLEREACAKIAEDHANSTVYGDRSTAESIAAEIRARSWKP